MSADIQFPKAMVSYHASTLRDLVAHHQCMLDIMKECLVDEPAGSRYRAGFLRDALFHHRALKVLRKIQP